MGVRYVPHTDMCGCERCALAWESEHPRQVYDAVEDPDILPCGCDLNYGCTCDDYPDLDGEEE